jgi:hypothetical protein
MSDIKIDTEILESKRIGRELVKHGLKTFLLILGNILSSILLGVLLWNVELETPIRLYHLLLIVPFPFMCWVYEVQGKEWEKFKKDNGLPRPDIISK